MILELKCPVNQYHWGKLGLQSLVAKLKQSADWKFEVDSKTPYAELWMGTHVNGPAQIKETGIPLLEWIMKNPDSLGEDSRINFGNDLPFLFKVLSIRMPLSIQVHPSKETAELLHSKFPDIYKDPNHKPELAVALSKFEALCGFRPANEIRKFLISIPELSEVIGKSNVDELLTCDDLHWADNLKKCFESLMTASPDLVKIQLDILIDRMTHFDNSTYADALGALLCRIHEYFPGDVGCFCIYFFNYLVLKPGEALYLGANVPHAYISGDCIECMACSDNVIRAGLTPKYRDVNTLIEVLDYTSSKADSKLLPFERESNCSVVYRPPFPEFAVCQVRLEAGQQYNLIRNSASLVIIITGHAKIDDIEATEGNVYFISAGESHQLQVCESTGVLMYQAFVNV